MAKKNNKKSNKKTTAKAATKKTNNKVKKDKPNKQSNQNKPKAKKKENKEFFLIRWVKSTGNFFGGVRNELGKVVWPTKTELGQSTAVVVIMVVAFTVFVWGFDTIVGYIVNLLYGLL